MDPTLQWKVQESVENNSVKRERRPLHLGHFSIPPTLPWGSSSPKGTVFLHCDCTCEFKVLKETSTLSFRDISLVFIFCSTLISGMFSISQSARPRSLDHSQERHSLTIRIKCPCQVYPGHRFVLRMSEESRRRVYIPWTPCHSNNKVLGNKGFLWRLVRGWSSLMVIPTLHSSRQWAISKKPAI